MHLLPPSWLKPQRWVPPTTISPASILTVSWSLEPSATSAQRPRASHSPSPASGRKCSRCPVGFIYLSSRTTSRVGARSGEPELWSPNPCCHLLHSSRGGGGAPGPNATCPSSLSSLLEDPGISRPPPPLPQPLPFPRFGVLRQGQRRSSVIPAWGRPGHRRAPGRAGGKAPSAESADPESEAICQVGAGTRVRKRRWPEGTPWTTL